MRDDDFIDGEIESEGPRPVAPASSRPAEVEYDLHILRTAWDVDYSTYHVEFHVPDAPKMPWSKVQGVYLSAYVVVRHRVEPSKRLGAGSSSGALARRSVTFESPDMDTRSVQDAPVPEAPSDEEIAAACKRSLQRHLDAVEKELARAKMAEEVDAATVGKVLRVKA